jgi:hypothetical protein
MLLKALVWGDLPKSCHFVQYFGERWVLRLGAIFDNVAHSWAFSLANKKPANLFRIGGFVLGLR